MTKLTTNFCYICSKELDNSSELAPMCPEHGYLWPLKRNSVNGDALIINDHGQVLLGRRAHEPNKGCWGMPGGFTNYGEHPKETAVREALEESGWRIEVVDLLGVYLDENIGDPNAEYRVAITYICKPVTQINHGDGESAELSWFDLDKLPDNLNPDHISPINDYRNSRERE